MKRFLLGYEVSSNGESTHHSHEFNSHEELDVWLVTTKKGIESKGGEIKNEVIIDRAM